MNTQDKINLLRGRRMFIGNREGLEIAIQGCNCCDNPMISWAYNEKKYGPFDFSSPKEVTAVSKKFDRVYKRSSAQSFIDWIVDLESHFGEVDHREGCAVR